MERKAGHAKEVKEGTMKEVDVDGTPILLVRLDDTLRAYSARCPHYGAPLAEGALSDGRIICPWHHACFDARSGDLLEPPALDALATFPVRVDGDDILVDVPDEPADRRTLPESRIADAAADVIAIVGAGAAGLVAAQTIRECGDRRRIVMITQESRLAYDRPNLSKDYLDGHADPAWLPLRSDEYYAEQRIETVTNARVARLRTTDRAIELADGRTIRYDTAVVATGCAPRRLTVPGAELAGVHTLRSYDDADAIIAGAGMGKRAVVVGASFIAMEAAAALSTRGVQVTLVAPDRVPFERVLGELIGRRLRMAHEEKGVEFRLGAELVCFEGEGRVEAAVLASGERIPCDLVVVGIGVTAVTDLIEGVELDESGGIVVDRTMLAAPGLYAAGDIAAFPDPRGGERVRIEHWRTAMQLGRIAGQNVAGVAREFDDVPFFWTRQFDTTLHYAGHARRWDEIVVRGDIERGAFIAYYVAGGAVLAAAAVDRDRDLIEAGERMRRSRRVTIDEMPQ